MEGIQLLIAFVTSLMDGRKEKKSPMDGILKSAGRFTLIEGMSMLTFSAARDIVKGVLCRLGEQNGTPTAGGEAAYAGSCGIL